jgi:hypothetical protein
MAETKSNNSKVFYRRHAKNSDEDVDDKFDVEVPKAGIAVFFVAFAVLLVVQYFIPELDMDWWAPPLFAILTIPVILLWGKLGPGMAQKFILAWLKKTSEKKKNTPVEIFMGFPSRVKDPYYIEANPVDFDIANTKMFVSRVMDVVFLSIGLSIFIANTVFSVAPEFAAAQVAKWGYSNPAEMTIFSAIYLGPFSLLVLFVVQPMIWIGIDMQIYRVDDLQDTQRVGWYLKSGMLAKILGFFGIIMAFNTAQDFVFGTSDYPGAFPNAAMMTQWILTFTYFAIILVACAAFPFITALVYLLKYHKEWVNTTRIKASEFLPCATMQVNFVEKEELDYLTHPERIQEFDKPDIFDKPNGKFIIIGLTIVTALVAFWAAFIY